jgi:hypothetical protein
MNPTRGPKLSRVFVAFPPLGISLTKRAMGAKERGGSPSRKKIRKHNRTEKKRKRQEEDAKAGTAGQGIKVD